MVRKPPSTPPRVLLALRTVELRLNLGPVVAWGAGVTDGAAAEFGDVGHGALVVVGLDTHPDLFDKVAD